MTPEFDRVLQIGILRSCRRTAYRPHAPHTMVKNHALRVRLALIFACITDRSPVGRHQQGPPSFGFPTAPGISLHKTMSRGASERRRRNFLVEELQVLRDEVEVRPCGRI